MSRVHPPPRLATRILAVVTTERYRTQQLGDLVEEFSVRTERSGRREARRWYWRQVARSVGPCLTIRARALRGFHVVERISMDTILQDLRYSVRSSIKSPGFAIVATVTLALAIAVNAAIFSLVNVVAFADLPMRNPETVAIFRATNSALGVERGSFSPVEYLAYRDRSSSFSEIAAWRSDQWVLTGGDEPIRVDGARATPNFLTTWGLGTVRGRGFLPSEAVAGAPDVAIISHGFWTRRFGADPGILDATLVLDGTPYTVIGVATPELEFANLREVDVWVPLVPDPTASRDDRNTFITGRLAAGVDVATAQGDISDIAAQLARDHPGSAAGWEPLVLGARDSLLDSQARLVFALLMMTVGFVLLIACANVANMLLARATARRRELAVRTALGATRTRVIRQLLTESFVLGIAATTLGLGLSRALMGLLVRITKGQQDLFLMATLDENVLIFTAGIAMVTPLVFGLLPAVTSTRRDVSASLREGGVRAGGGRQGSRLRNVLVGAQISLALMLMILAGLFARTIANIQRLDLGFETAQVLTMELSLPEHKYPDAAARERWYRSLVDRLNAVPGTRGVALSQTVPGVFKDANRGFEIAGRPVDDDRQRPFALLGVVSADFFDLIAIPVVEGRGITAGDDRSASPVAVISRETARRHWPDGDAIGARIRTEADSTAPWRRIVGVVGDVERGEEAGVWTPQVYLPFAQVPAATMLAFIKTVAPEEAAAATARGAVWALDPAQPIGTVRSLERAIYDDRSTDYALITLFAIFAVFALGMSAIGIYGVTSYSVSQRGGEIGLRMALGARGADVRMMILRQGGRLVLAGSMLGMLGAIALSRLVTGLVYGISALDPVTFIGVPVVLAAVGVLANYIPARRATRIDPMRALRIE